MGGADALAADARPSMKKFVKREHPCLGLLCSPDTFIPFLLCLPQPWFFTPALSSLNKKKQIPNSSI
jgi:hypothetical protein